MTEPTVSRRNVTLNLAQGLHIRACSRVVAIVNSFLGDVTISNGEKRADARSMFDLMQLAAIPGSDLLLEANGVQPDDVLDQLVQLFAAEGEPTD